MTAKTPNPTDQPQDTPTQGALHAFSQNDYFGTLIQMAEWGDAKSQHNLGAMCLEGVEVKQDFAEALKWHSLAAEQGMPLAQHDLATMYMDGLGVPEDHEKAAYWFDKAAQQGDAKALNNLGIMYATGQGVEANLVKAYQYFSLAAKGGLMDALDNREFALEDMTPEQREQVK